MTLIVSLRIPDGLVLAADSLSTNQARIGIAADVNVKCPKCDADFQLHDLKLPPFPVPSSTFSFAQKLFPFCKKFGVASYGIGILNQKTIYHHIKELETKVSCEDFKEVTKVAQEIHKYFDEQLKKQIRDIDQAPDDFYPLGFQIVGYDNEEGKTIEVNIGKKSKITPRSGIGCTVSGDIKVVIKLWELRKEIPQQGAIYGSFSLQDAIDYAKYLINTTANYQRFANIIPTVGGSVDIAMITPYKGFIWIESKKLTSILERRNNKE